MFIPLEKLRNRLRPCITTNEDFPRAKASFSRAVSSILSTNFIHTYLLCVANIMFFLHNTKL